MNLPLEFFPLPPRVEWVDPRKGIFRAPFAFISPTLGKVEIETGFDTDYASVPRALWWLYPPDGPYSPIAWIHDYLYWYQALADGGLPVTREQADTVFLEGLRVLPGIRATQRKVMFRGVRMGGGKAWAENAAKRKGEAMDPTSATHIKQHFHKLRR